MGWAEVPTDAPMSQSTLAQRIREDKDMVDVLERARTLLKGSLNAGSGYPEVWIRDLATFLPIACQVNDPAEIRRSLLLLLRFQGEDGNIPDGVGHRDGVSSAPPVEPGAPPAPLKVTERSDRLVIERPDVPDYVAFKNSVETDQESSLVLAVDGYLKATRDTGILQADVDGQSVLERMERALGFLLERRFSEKYRLIWGGTTIDWGDIAPEDPVGAVLGPKSHRAVDIYDNATFLLAIEALLPLVRTDEAKARHWHEVESGIRGNVRKFLWDAGRGKFIPHLYLDGSPFPGDFDEAAVWYHGGTAVAIQAGLLSREETLASLAAMRRNVREAGGLTVGLTNYPVYPKGCFLNPNVDPWVYQNGGDWDWFGARMVQALAAAGCVEEAYEELRPMVKRVQRHDGFFEWFDMKDQPQGSARFKGSAGELGRAILAVQAATKTQR